MNIWYHIFDICEIGIAERNGKITDIFFKNEGLTFALRKEQLNGNLLEKKSKVIELCISQLKQYLAGKRVEFDLPLDLVGTDFQKKAWAALLTIPYGETRSYKQIAEQIGNPKAMRAVGGANNKNPIAIVVPCHRVIGQNGKLVGYAAGVDIKEKLLELEKEVGKL